VQTTAPDLDRYAGSVDDSERYLILGKQHLIQAWRIIIKMNRLITEKTIIPAIVGPCDSVKQSLFAYVPHCLFTR
jgi:hypothetical protein